VRIAGLLVGFPLVATFLNALIMGSRHFFLSAWPDHAYHHLARQIVLDCGIAALGLLLLYRFIRVAKERWLWWGLLVVGVSIFGGYWLSSAVLGLGEPNLLAYSTRVAYTSIYAAGLVLLWRGFGSEASP
jgi:hypothetical protein